MKAEKKEKKFEQNCSTLVPEQPERVQFSLFHPDTKLFSEMNTIGMLVKNLKYGTHISCSKV